jgi:DNA-directed RNA polymerase subunit L
LRPQWNPTAPVEQLILKAKASISNGTENIRYSPVTQASYEYTRDNNVEHLNTVFTSWLSLSKKIEDSSKISDEQAEAYKREFNTMEVQRCYIKDERGNPYDFTFHVESVGVQSVPIIVESALIALQSLVAKYIDIDTVLSENVKILQADARYPAIDVWFTNEGHTLGNLLETFIVDNHIDGNEKPTVNYIGYKVPHPLRPEMFLRIGVGSETPDDVEEQKNIVRMVIATACRNLKEQFKALAVEWKSIFTQ